MHRILLPFLHVELFLSLQSVLLLEVKCDTNFRMKREDTFDKVLEDKHQDHTCKDNISFVWCIPSNYNVEEDPFRYTSLTNNSLPWSYDFKFIIKEVSNVNDKAQSISVSMYFGVRWFEPRLIINESAEDWTEPKLGPDDHVNISPETIKDLWYPDLEIYGLEKFHLHKVLKEMSGVRIIKNQSIDYELRVVITISCQMDFNDYPLDTHICPFQIGSYFGTVSTVTCSSQFEFDEKRQRSLQYFTEIIPLSTEHQNVTLPSGEYAACGFTIGLHRMRMQNLIQVYLPTTMFVMTSWVSFLIKPEVVPGRMALLITLFLVLTNIFNGVKADAPASKRLNAVDLYLVVCIFLVFAALVEYSVILYIQKKNKRLTCCSQNSPRSQDLSLEVTLNKKEQSFVSPTSQLSSSKVSTRCDQPLDDNKTRLYQIRSRSIEVQDNTNTEQGKNKTNFNNQVNERYTENLCENIDMISLWMAPVLFIVFSIIYWVLYI